MRPSPVTRSALWAAWGDALGFPVEMVRSPASLRKRVGTESVAVPAGWERRIGGRGGPTLKLPAGAYSDDTQLRLAVARCIRASGRFDAEAFSKIELPVFLSYELGAGRATRAAAHALTGSSVRWHSNFFDSRDVAYVNGGGNGAAMRVQPHVWAAPDHRADAYLPGLLRDAVTTHGHPRGILGAAWHALALGAALRDGAIPGPELWPKLVRSLGRIPSRMAADDKLGERWMPRWQAVTGRPFADAVDEIVRECAELTDLAIGLAGGEGPLEERYAALVQRAGGLRAATRGAGTLSAALSLWLAWNSAADPARGVRAAANLRGSDTDTIATMAGALLGAIAGIDPPGDLLDRELHAASAQRLDRLRDGRPVEDFPHPDTLSWTAPPTLADAVGLVADSMAVFGLGPVRPRGEPVPGIARHGFAWQWVETGFGQTLLIKRRPELAELPSGARPLNRRAGSAAAPLAPPESEQIDISVASRDGLPNGAAEALALAVEDDFDELTIGRLIVHLARQPDGSARARAFVEMLVAALGERPIERRGPEPPLDGDQLALLG